MGELCNIYLYAKYLFYGLVKYRLPIQGQREVKYEKMINEPSRAATILPQIRQSVLFQNQTEGRFKTQAFKAK